MSRYIDADVLKKLRIDVISGKLDVSYIVNKKKLPEGSFFSESLLTFDFFVV